MAETATESNPKPNLGFLRIGLFTDTYAPQVNGISISLQLVSEGLLRRGHQVTIFAPRIPGYTDDQPGVLRIPALKYLNDPPVYVAVLGTPRSTWSLTRKHFDVLHAHSPMTVGLPGISHCFNKEPAPYLYLSYVHNRLHTLRQIHWRHTGDPSCGALVQYKVNQSWRPDRCAIPKISSPAFGAESYQTHPHHSKWN